MGGKFSMANGVFVVLRGVTFARKVGDERRARKISWMHRGREYMTLKAAPPKKMMGYPLGWYGLPQKSLDFLEI